MDFTQQLGAFIGLASLMFAMATWVYTRLSRIETNIAVIKSTIEALERRVDLLYSIIVEDNVRAIVRKGEAHASDLRQSPAIRQKLDEHADPKLVAKLRVLALAHLDATDAELFLLLIQDFGWDVVNKRSRVYDMQVQEYLALMVARTREIQRGEP